MIKLNLGSGPSGREGWVNLDWGWLPWLGKHRSIRRMLVKSGVLGADYDIDWPAIKLHDIRKRLPFETDSVDYVYCSHVLEHLEKWEGARLIGEARRVLKSKGKMRLVLPDLELMIKKYGDQADEFCRVFFGYDKEVEPKGLVGRLKRGAIRPHQWNYGRDSIIKLLTESGFKKIEISGYRKGGFPDINQLDLEIHKDLSLYVEATK